jgi:hypothetical protein
MHFSSEAPDVRHCPIAGVGGNLRTGSLYRVMRNGEGVHSAESAFVWRNQAPPRVHFFGWLVNNGLVQCLNLARKKLSKILRVRLWASPRGHGAHLPLLRFCFQFLGCSGSPDCPGPQQRYSEPASTVYCPGETLQHVCPSLLLATLETQKCCGVPRGKITTCNNHATVPL